MFAVASPTAALIILVVEDDPDVRSALAELLSGEGYEVAATADGGEALDTLRAGLQPCRHLAGSDDAQRATAGTSGGPSWTIPSWPSVPVVLLTASGFQPDSMRSERGRLEMLPKPVQAHVLLDTVARLAAG